MEGLSAEDPSWIGGYRLLGRLGEGGMGRVYLARSGRGRTVAVKVVQSELARSPDFRRRFAQEVTSAQRVGDTWTAPVLDSDTEAGTPWVATGYVPGPSLAEVVSDQYGPLPEETVHALAAGLTRALQAIHGAGLVHRDLKPSNVLITIDGPRVIDFGIARALDAAVQSVHGLTRTGAVVGSPGFISPEQVRGEKVTPASDVFCLGAVLTFAATGRLPFRTEEGNVHAMLFSVTEDEPDLTGVPERLLPLIGACLAKDPAGRPTVEALLESLGPDAEPDGAWLPGAVLAQLGRRAVELLDSEDPEAHAQAGPALAGHPPAGEHGAVGAVGAGGAAGAVGGAGSGSGGGAAVSDSPLPGAFSPPPGGAYGPPGPYVPPQHPHWNSPPPAGGGEVPLAADGAPVPPGARPPRRMGALGAWLTAALYVMMAVLLVRWMLHTAIVSSIDSASDSLALSNVRDYSQMRGVTMVTEVLEIMTGLGVALLWVLWFRRARMNAEAFKPGGVRYSEGMSIGAWFIPFANLFIPKQISNDIWQISLPATRFNPTLTAPGQSPYSVKRGVLHAWWVLWLCFFVLTNIVLSLPWYDMSSVGQGAVWALYGQFTALVGVAASVLALIVVRRLGKAQNARILGTSPR